jgi:hypothetical protein
MSMITLAKHTEIEQIRQKASAEAAAEKARIAAEKIELAAQAAREKEAAKEAAKAKREEERELVRRRKEVEKEAIKAEKAAEKEKAKAEKAIHMAEEKAVRDAEKAAAAAVKNMEKAKAKAEKDAAKAVEKAKAKAEKAEATAAKKATPTTTPETTPPPSSSGGSVAPTEHTVYMVAIEAIHDAEEDSDPDLVCGVCISLDEVRSELETAYKALAEDTEDLDDDHEEKFQAKVPSVKKLEAALAKDKKIIVTELGSFRNCEKFAVRVTVWEATVTL